MHQAIHSPFLQALGYAIINSLWQFALLWLLYFFVNTIFKLSSRQKYTAGLVLQIAGFTWFILTVVFYYRQTSLLTQTVFINHSYYEGITDNTGASVKEQFFHWLSRAELLFPYLSVAYLVLLFFLALKWLNAYRNIQVVRTKGLIKIDADWRLFVKKIALQLGLNRPVQIFLSDAVQTPLTIGFFKPLILIPLAAINYLNTQQMEAVILHELAHIKRFDYLFNLLLALIEACLFFNPFMQLIKNHIKRERENCCDDWVIQYEYNAHSYARALLQIASFQTSSPLLAMKATADKHLLLNRIKRMIERKEKSLFNYKHQLIAFLVMTTVFSSLALLTGRKMNKTEAANKHSHVVFEPLAANINNPLFNPVFFLANAPKTDVQKKKQQEPPVLKTLEGVRQPPPPPLPAKADEEDGQSITLPEINSEAAQQEESPVRDNIKITFENSKNELEKQMQEVDAQKLFVNLFANNEKAAKNAERAVTIALNNKRFVLKGEFRRTIESAFANLKSAKKELELMKVKSVTPAGIRKLQRQNVIIIDQDVINGKLDELKSLENLIEMQVDSVKQTVFYSTNYNTDYHFLAPPAVYIAPLRDEEHSYSYEYSRTPRAAVSASVTSYKRIKAAKRNKNKPVDEDGNEPDRNEDVDHSEPVPFAPAVRTFSVIKI